MSDANKVYITNTTTGVPELISRTTFVNSSGWALRGNTGNQDNVTNLLGNTDDVAINFTINGQKSGRIGNSTDLNISYGYRTITNNITGYYNSAFGKESLSLNNSGYENSSFGYLAMQRNMSGFNNSAFGSQALLINTSGSDNTAIGTNSLIRNVSGTGNTGIGSTTLTFNTGNNNTAVGHSAGAAITTGSGNILIGSNAGSALTTTSNTLVIANTNTALPLVSGQFATNGGTLTLNNGLGVATSAPSTTSTLNINGSFATGILRYTTGGSLTLNESHHSVRILGALATSITLPAAADAKGRVYRIINGSAAALSFVTAVVNPDGTAIAAPAINQVITIQSDGTDWVKISQ
ncbi:MAG: hypothetical protein EOO43_10035 [Flavobacterium sp.]|nr:MAG: hypothetical protein EOO43_10035 [Flavobacterium sp.]